MEYWNNIINVAMIGTDKKTIDALDLPEHLKTPTETILTNESIDKEEQYFQMSALAFNYRQCGVLPLFKEQVTLEAAPAEDRLYCKPTAQQVLRDIISFENITLLNFWLQHCMSHHQIIHPEMVPALMEIGTQQKALQTAIATCCGKRGAWLAKFNEAWSFSTIQTTEALWQTGTLEQRKKVFTETRKTDAAKAMEWLMQTWPQEDANTKLAFLELFKTNISEFDVDFLQGLSTEKSKKVKDEAIQLLKHIPSSIIVLQYIKLLEQSISLVKEKTLLGLSSQIVLKFHLPEIDESVFKSGIQKLSSSKTFTDDEFILYQLIQAVPPTFWEHHLKLNMEEIIAMLTKDDIGKKMLPALVDSIVKFKDIAWANKFTNDSDTFYIDFLPLLTNEQQEFYSNKFFDQFPSEIIQFSTTRKTEWGLELTEKVMAYASKNIYHFSRSFFAQHILLIPEGITAQIETYAPQEEYLRNTWNNTSNLIIKLLELKSRIRQAFN